MCVYTFTNEKKKKKSTIEPRPVPQTEFLKNKFSQNTSTPVSTQLPEKQGNVYDTTYK